MGHSKLNIHTVKIVKSIAEYGEIPLEELDESHIIANTNALMNHLIANQQDWCLDTVLEIIYYILHNVFKRLQHSKNASIASSTIAKEGMVETEAIVKLIMIAEKLVDNFELCMELLSSSDPTLVEKSVQAVFVMLQIFGAQRVPEQRQVYFIEGHMRHLTDALGTVKLPMKKKVLKCMVFALDQEGHRLMLTEEQKTGITRVVDPLVNLADSSVANTASKLLVLLNN